MVDCIVDCSVDVGGDFLDWYWVFDDDGDVGGGLGFVDFDFDVLGFVVGVYDVVDCIECMGFVVIECVDVGNFVGSDVGDFGDYVVGDGCFVGCGVICDGMGGCGVVYVGFV